LAQVAFLGLGIMGAPMARHLAVKGGHQVCVYNRTLAKAQKWVADNGGRANAISFSPASAMTMICAP
jgi:3-hydroxyisobutyrate dehydrogenase